MTEGVFVLLGVLLGAGLTWFQTYWTQKKDSMQNARYLAIRVVCILDQFMENCAEVVREDGLRFGQPDAEWYSKPRILAPEGPFYPDNVDWKSIDHELMYKILAFPSEVSASKPLINDMWEIAQESNYLDFYSERAFWYSRFGLHALTLSRELASKYGIKSKTYPSWNPEKEFVEKHRRFSAERDQRLESYRGAVRTLFYR